MTQARPLILVADDDPGARLFVRQALEPAGMVVSEATGGREAIDLSSENLMRDVAIAILPLFLLTATLVILFLRGIMSQVRSRIGRILLDAMDDSHDPLDKPVELSKAG